LQTKLIINQLKSKVMKKVLCILAAVAMVAVFSTSCKKGCTCKTYSNGDVVATATYENISKDQCKALTVVATGSEGKTGVECK
jgi:hypothetical protein